MFSFFFCVGMLVRPKCGFEKKLLLCYLSERLATQYFILKITTKQLNMRGQPPLIPIHKPISLSSE